jgi:hypothetical protein
MAYSSMSAKLLLPLITGVLLIVPALTEAAETDRWQALFAAVPPLPASPAEAISKIKGRKVNGQIRVEITDSGLRTLQREADDLYAATAKTSQAQVQSQLDKANSDPELARLGRRIDDVVGLNKQTGKPPKIDELKKLNKDVESILGAGATSRDIPPAAMSDIAAYRLELQRMQPHSASFLKRLFELQHRYAQQHAQADRDAIKRIPAVDAMAVTHSLIARHHELASRQLADAAGVFAEARNTLHPRFAKMAQLARVAELRNASPAERIQAYSLFKSYLELLLTLQRETLEDVGFWAGIRARTVLRSSTTGGAQSLYEHSQAPDIDLQGNGELTSAGQHYPGGREIVVGLPPGIR